MAEAVTLVDLLRAAGKDLTRESIMKTLRTKSASFAGPWIGPLKYSADDYSGLTTSRIAIDCPAVVVALVIAFDVISMSPQSAASAVVDRAAPGSRIARMAAAIRRISSVTRSWWIGSSSCVRRSSSVSGKTPAGSSG